MEHMKMTAQVRRTLLPDLMSPELCHHQRLSVLYKGEGGPSTGDHDRPGETSPTTKSTTPRTPCISQDTLSIVEVNTTIQILNLWKLWF